MAPMAAPVANLEFKAFLLLIFMLLLVCSSAVYVLYARGAFEAKQHLVLVAEDAEGVVVGMDMTFAGFPIGRVHGVELGVDGNARILVDVPKKDAHWLRTSSVFTLVRGLVGGTNIRAYSGMLTDPPLADGAVRQVLRGDATAEVPRLVTATKELIDKLNTLAAEDGPLSASLSQVRSLTERINGPGGALGVMFGGAGDPQKISGALDRSNILIERATALITRLDGMAARADTQVLGEGGVVGETRATVVQLNGLLSDARQSLKRVDLVLQEAQAVGANVRGATTDLGSLRAEVEASLRKVDGLVNEINRKWPFARDPELKLP
ncbi:MAG: mammalian cell entry protein [Burkholderiaceae bacterium]|nr:mammalian cell entry protein [Burkholderiaceae bacterium]